MRLHHSNPGGVATLTAPCQGADTSSVRSPNLSVWLLVIPGAFLQLVGANLPDLALLSLGTAVQGIGLWIHCRAKGRSRWWALLALAPGLGWVGAAYLRSPAQLEALAREKANRRMTRKDSRMSRMAVAAFAAGAAYFVWPFFSRAPGIPACLGLTAEVEEVLGGFLAVVLPLTAVAMVFGLIANFLINRSDGRLRGRWLAQLAVFLSVVNLLQTMALPRFYLWQEFGAETVALRTIHRAEKVYRSRYPEIGYSPDLQSLGPPAPSVAASVERAGIVDDPLSKGIYCTGKDRLAYEPQVEDDGTIVAYSIRLDSRGSARFMDESGAIEFVANPPERRERHAAAD